MKTFRDPVHNIIHFDAAFNNISIDKDLLIKLNEKDASFLNY